MKIVAVSKEDEKPLPKFIKLNNNLGCMKLRQQQSVLRRYKIKEKNVHEYYYSQLLLFLPWRNEVKDLKLWNVEECHDLFEEKAN